MANPPTKPTVEGGLKLFNEIRVSAADMATWTPERIAAFFEGMRRVVAAVKDEPPAGEKHHEGENAMMLSEFIDALRNSASLFAGDNEILVEGRQVVEVTVSFPNERHQRTILIKTTPPAGEEPRCR